MWSERSRVTGLKQHGEQTQATGGTFAWLILALLWLCYALNYADRQCVFSILPALHRELGFSDIEFGLAGSLFTWVYSVSMPFTGAIADRTSRPAAVVFSVLLWSSATFGTALSRSVSQFLWWRGLTGLTEAFYVPAAYGLLAILFPQRLRSRVLAIHATAQFAGIVAGSSYGGWMADHIGWRTGFRLAGGLGITYVVVVMLVFRRLPRSGVRRQEPLLVSLAAFRSNLLATLAGAFFAFCLLLWILYAWLPPFVYERFHLSMTRSGITASVALQAGSAVGVILGGFLGDHFARQYAAARLQVAGTGLLLCAPFAWLSFATPSLFWLQFATAGFGVLSGLFVANVFAAAMDAVAERSYSFVTASLNMAGGIAGGAGILLTGVWRARLGIPNIIAIATAMVGITAAGLLWIAARLRRNERSAG